MRTFIFIITFIISTLSFAQSDDLDYLKHNDKKAVIVSIDIVDTYLREEFFYERSPELFDAVCQRIVEHFGYDSLNAIFTEPKNVYLYNEFSGVRKLDKKDKKSLADKTYDVAIKVKCTLHMTELGETGMPTFTMRYSGFDQQGNRKWMIKETYRKPRLWRQYYGSFEYRLEDFVHWFYQSLFESLPVIEEGVSEPITPTKSKTYTK